MSLIKQLWFAIAFLMISAFIGSFVVSCLSAKAYLEEHLYRKNVDNASALALSLSSEARDPMMIELYINSQYDTGHYQHIQLIDANGDIIVEQNDDSDFNEAPAWLIALFPIKVEPGVAQVSQGWQILGTLTLSSHTRFAYQQLWANAKRLFVYFVIMAIGAGFIGTYILELITKPLHKAVDHAQAIGERRFITTTEPKTREFRAVIRSMNKLSQHVKDMLDDESSKLDKWRTDMQRDKVTGLLNREPTLNQLSAFLENEDAQSKGALVLVRIVDLFHLNQKEGRQTMDQLLHQFGLALDNECARGNSLGFAGRLNGSDLLVVVPGEDQHAQQTGRDVLKTLTRVCRETSLEKVRLLASSTPYYADETVGLILARIDSVLESAADRDTDVCIHVASDHALTVKNTQLDWENTLQNALANQHFTLQKFPVYSNKQEILHWETPVRLIQENQDLLTAGQFMPHISRLGLGPQLDLVVTHLAIEHIKKNQQAIGINLSASILSQPTKMAELKEIISQHHELADKLWLEVPEYGAFQNMEGFRVLCQLLKPLNCKLGIEHVGQEVTHIGELHDLGLDYVKIDRSLIYNVNDTMAYQVFLRGLCTIVHSIGLVAIAEGVTTKEEWTTLKELGIDGGTGTFFS